MKIKEILNPPVRVGHYPSLLRLVQDSNVKIFDIGARGGDLKGLKHLTPYMDFICCDADPSESENLKERIEAQTHWRSIAVIPKAITNQCGPVNLHITRQPGLSSLLPPNQKVVKEYYASQEWEIQKTVTVEGLQLDQAIDQYNLGEISFLKLDTQGTEFDILKSGGKRALPHLVGIYLEMEFQPFYTGQSLFGDVHSYLERVGFSLIDLKRTFLRRNITNKPIYSKRELTWAHCLYLKKDPSSYAQTRRAVSLCLALDYFDRASCLLTDSKYKNQLNDEYGDRLNHELIQFANDVWSRQQRWPVLKGLIYGKSREKSTRDELLKFNHNDRKFER